MATVTRLSIKSHHLPGIPQQYPPALELGHLNENKCDLGEGDPVGD